MGGQLSEAKRTVTLAQGCLMPLCLRAYSNHLDSSAHTFSSSVLLSTTLNTSFHVYSVHGYLNNRGVLIQCSTAATRDRSKVEVGGCGC